MLDIATREQAGLQRARGRAHVTLKAARGAVRLDRLHQSGSAKAMLPRCHGPVPEVVFLNTAGGVTGGDRFSYGLDLGAGTRAVATTQTAERIYASSGGAGRIASRFAVGEGARLHWLPQETILFDKSALERETVIDLAPGAACLLAESLVLGRAAMGEEVTALALTDRRLVRRGGQPVFADPLRLDAGHLAARDHPAGLAGARALATLALVEPGAEDALAAARAVIEGAGDGAGVVTAAASAWDGRLVVRALAPEAAPLRRLVARLLETLGRGALPRVWQY